MNGQMDRGGWLRALAQRAMQGRQGMQGHGWGMPQGMQRPMTPPNAAVPPGAEGSTPTVQGMQPQRRPMPAQGMFPPGWSQNMPRMQAPQGFAAPQQGPGGPMQRPAMPPPQAAPQGPPIVAQDDEDQDRY